MNLVCMVEYEAKFVGVGLNIDKVDWLLIINVDILDGFYCGFGGDYWEINIAVFFVFVDKLKMIWWLISSGLSSVLCNWVLDGSWVPWKQKQYSVKVGL